MHFGNVSPIIIGVNLGLCVYRRDALKHFKFLCFFCWQDFHLHDYSDMGWNESYESKLIQPQRAKSLKSGEVV